MTDTRIERNPLRVWRLKNGLKQSELAELAGVTRSTVDCLERGHYGLMSPSGHKVALALGIEITQLQQEDWSEKVDVSDWYDYRNKENAPREPLAWWLKKRSLSLSELSAISQVSMSTVRRLAYGEDNTPASARVRRHLANALMVSPESLILPGDNLIPSSEKTLEQILRSELRAARHIIRRWHDVSKDGRYLTNRAYDDLTRLIEDTARELRGT